MDKAVSGGLQQILDAEAHSTGCFQTEDAPYSWVILDFGERSPLPCQKHVALLFALFSVLT